MKIRFLHPSSAHRWWQDACPGSVRAEATAPLVDNEGNMALEGSAAHRLFEICLSKKHDAESYLDEDIQLLKPKAKYTVNADMAEHVQDGIDLIRRYVGKGVLWTEQTVNVKVKGVQAGGTLDAGWHGLYYKDALDKKKGTEWQLHVMDLKYGYLAVTAPSENKQLKIYTLGKVRELMNKGKKIDTIHLWIYQPRLDTEFPFRHEIITPYEINEFEMELEESVEMVQSSRAPLRAGSHCLYCKALGTCKEAERATFKVFRSKYTETDRERVGDLMFQLPQAQAWIKALKDLGTTMGLHGTPPIGWVMGAGRRNKRWTGDKEKTLKTIGPKLKAIGLTEEEYAPRKLISPAKAMTLVKSHPKHKSTVEKLWFWAPGKPRLQPENNARHSVNTNAFFDSHDDPDGLEE